MNTTQEHHRLLEQYLIHLAEATFPLKEKAEDRELTLEVLIEAADLLRDNLRQELAELRAEQD